MNLKARMLGATAAATRAGKARPGAISRAKALAATLWCVLACGVGSPADAWAAEPAGGVILNEVLAANRTGLQDEDGDSSDWIELHNRGTEAVNLEGWSLTDEPGLLAKWRLPSGVLPAGGYRVIFASGKDRRLASGEWHTNFRLDRAGEYLGLVDPSNHVVSEFGPAYPPQAPDVAYGRDAVYPAAVGYYPEPTPGRANGVSAGVTALPAVEFSVRPGTFTQPFSVALSLPSAMPGVEIRYQLVREAVDGAGLPTLSSLLYTGPVAVANSVLVRARAYASGGVPGPVSSAAYVRLQTNLLDFVSELPVVVLHTLGTPPVPNGYSTSNHSPGIMAVYEPRGGRTTLTQAPSLITRVGLNVHGGSTAGYAKPSFNLETWDEQDRDTDVSLLGMPAESDWLFHAVNHFEPTLFHHSFINELSRDAGRYAPRTRLVEVFVSTNAPGQGRIGPGQYQGVYEVMEKIKRGPDRVAIDRLDARDTNGPAATGGYLLKIERVELHEGVVSIPTVGGVPGTTLILQDPESRELNLAGREEQRRQLSAFLLAAATNLAGAGFADPANGYVRYLEPSSWIDQHLLNVFAFNVDAVRLGGFYAKTRDVVNERGEIVVPGRLQAGPLYDLDRALGSPDGRPFNPRVWRSEVGDQGTDFFHIWWYDRLFQDVDFWQRWVDRWQELRGSVLALEGLMTRIDTLREQVRGAQEREQARWGTIAIPRTGRITVGSFSHDFGAGGYDAEVAFLKRWISNRVDFIDTNFLASPRLAVTGGPEAGWVATLSLAAGAEAGTVIYYTLDGSDPRRPGGAVSPAAHVYTGPLLVAETARLVARAWNPNHRNLTGPNNPPRTTPWSGPVTQTLVRSLPGLRISELMFRPSGDPSRPLQYEFIELQNVGAPLNLRGFRLTGAVEFTFPDLHLDSGQFVVVTGDRAGFEARYGTVARVAGQYQSALPDAGGRMRLEGPLGEVIHDFAYRAEWSPAAAGLGFSLVHKNPGTPVREYEEGELVDNWDRSDSWRPSVTVGGSPGVEDPLPPVVTAVQVNEVLARPVSGEPGFIELANPWGPDVDLGGWYLTDDLAVPAKLRIPDGTLLRVGEHVVIPVGTRVSSTAASSGLVLAPEGGTIFLISADGAGRLTGYVDSFRHGPTWAGVSSGRMPLAMGGALTANGEPVGVPQSATTPGAANAGPRVGPVVVSEVHYHPVDFVGGGVRTDNVEDEFIELRNLTAGDLALRDLNGLAGSWSLGGDVRFTFPPGATIPGFGMMVVVPFDPEREPMRRDAFRARYQVSDEVRLVGPWTGRLGNAGGSVQLLAPDRIDYSATRAADVNVPLDTVAYSFEEPWPAAANGVGLSLSRAELSGFGSDAANWVAAGPSPGTDFVSGPLPVILTQPVSIAGVAYLPVRFSVVATADGALSYQWRYNGVPIPGATGPVLDLAAPEPSDAGRYDVVVMTGSGAVTSQGAYLTLSIPVRFLTQPEPRTVRPGESATFSVVVESAAPPVRYQWWRDDVALAGATNATLTLAVVGPADAGLYSCAVTDGVATRRSASAKLTVLVSPVIVVSPVSQSAAPGATVVFSVQVTNTATLPLGYRWRRNGGTVLFQELDSHVAYLAVSNVVAGAPVTYTVVVTNVALPAPGVLSSNAVLTVVADADGDGVPDAYELENGLNPGSAADALADGDGDGVRNRDEYLAGTDPRDPASYLKVDRVSLDGAVRIEFVAVSNRTYAVQSTDRLGAGPWTRVADVAARAETRVVTVPDARPGTNRFYRLVTPAQP